ncbi:MAG: ATP-dependent DNA helicase RecG [Nitrospirae bacterium]|nr:ATP-dependent DNA helicase RecG [Nitrospirota bacterium]
MNSTLRWETPVQFVKGIGPYKAVLLKKLGLVTVEDVLFNLPYRYEDRTKIQKISRLSPNENQMVFGEVKAVRTQITPRKHLKIFELILGDETGVLSCKWFNQPYLEKVFKTGQKVILTGKVSPNRFEHFRLEMNPVSYELVTGDEENLTHHGKIVPVYHETPGMTSNQMRSLIKSLLEENLLLAREKLPLALVRKYAFPSLGEALKEVHFPSGPETFFQSSLEKSLFHRRLVFEDFFLLEMGLALRKNKISRENKGFSFKIDGGMEGELLRHLSFKLTPAQGRVLGEIKKDMQSLYPMNRLLQGDVGSGKTVVALIAMLIAIENGFQACLMVPTELLAEQHYFNLTPLLLRLNIAAGLLTHGMGKKEQTKVLESAAEGKTDLVIGTHSLIQEKVQFKRLGIAVVDEQHKFGVMQRMELKKKGDSPDILIMTATPIPRTLALTVYGDLDLSVLDELPPGRKPIQTRLFYESQRKSVYSMIEKEVNGGRQAYIVYPLVEESEKLDLNAAVTMFKTLEETVFPQFKIGLLHGRMKSGEKERVMKQFKNQEIHILVSTTVIEVGIDVSNASLMVVEHAERFGLAQLHQLRGRVGRGPYQSYCLLVANTPVSEDAKKRLKAMVNTTDGFKLAEEDLAIRGPGEFFGTRQSGLPELRVANLLRDGKMLEEARREAMDLLQKDPLLVHPDHGGLKETLLRRWNARLDLQEQR